MNNHIYKTNGYTLKEEVQKMQTIFNTAIDKTFDGATVDHFNYGDCLDMATLVVGNGTCAYFNISKNRVSLAGGCWQLSDRETLEALTYNDELFESRLLEIANR